MDQLEKQFNTYEQYQRMVQGNVNVEIRVAQYRRTLECLMARLNEPKADDEVFIIIQSLYRVGKMMSDDSQRMDFIAATTLGREPFLESLAEAMESLARPTQCVLLRWAVNLLKLSIDDVPVCIHLPGLAAWNTAIMCVMHTQTPFFRRKVYEWFYYLDALNVALESEHGPLSHHNPDEWKRVNDDKPSEFISDDSETEALKMKVLYHLQRECIYGIHANSAFGDIDVLIHLFSGDDTDLIRFMWHLRHSPRMLTRDQVVDFLFSFVSIVLAFDVDILLEYLISEETIHVRGVPGGFLAVFLLWLGALVELHMENVKDLAIAKLLSQLRLKLASLRDLLPYNIDPLIRRLDVVLMHRNSD